MKIGSDLKSIIIEDDEIDVILDIITECDYTFLKNYKINDVARFYDVLSCFINKSQDCINFLKEDKL